ncbi:MAG: conjugal transfer protein TraC [Sphingobium sp.]|jgi:conjugal transfer ATP-binding protein TraC|nr:conjugal transfer protein TraC [Sphingobium sp.]
MLKSLNLGVAEVEPQQLIAIIDDLTSPTTAPQDDAVPYNPNDRSRPRRSATISNSSS